MPRVGVVIAGGGKGRRLGSRVPKQFILLGRKPILQRTVELFAGLESVAEIVVTIPQSHLPHAREILARIQCGKIISVVPGGKERQDSVWRGLHGFLSTPDIVLVHDAVRPFVDLATVERAIASATRFGAAVVGVRLQDTVKTEGKRGYYSTTLDRSKLWAVQTPQAFQYHILMKGHNSARKRGFLGTDESSLVERLGIPVRIVEGSPMNMKITTTADLAMAKMWLKEGPERHYRR